MSSALLSVKDVVVRYKAKGQPTNTAVRGVSLEVNPGEVVGIVGESGCGKSSLARAMVGLQAVAGGQILFGEHRVQPLPLRRRAAEMIGLQMVFQDPYASLNPRRRIKDQLVEVVRGARKAQRLPVPSAEEADAKAVEVLEMVGLNPALRERFPHALSGGQRQRIAIAKVLAVDTKVIIADEPIAALDASSQKHVAGLLRGLVTDLGLGMAIISHDLAVVASIADTTAVMVKGRFVEQGPTERVWTAPEDPYTAKLLGAVPALVRRAA